MATEKNICDCPDPPGGRAICGENQLAICRVTGGKVHTECHSVPRALAGQSGEATNNWVLSKVTLHPRAAGSPVTSDDLDILASGLYIDLDTGEEIRFQLPAGMSSMFLYRVSS